MLQAKNIWWARGTLARDKEVCQRSSRQGTWRQAGRARNLAPSNRHECAWLVVLCGRLDTGRVRQPSAKHPHTPRCAKSDNFATPPTPSRARRDSSYRRDSPVLVASVAPLLDKTRHGDPKELRFFFKNITPSETHICHEKHATKA